MTNEISEPAWSGHEQEKKPEIPIELVRVFLQEIEITNTLMEINELVKSGEPNPDKRYILTTGRNLCVICEVLRAICDRYDAFTGKNKRAQPKYERVDFDTAYKNFPEGDDIYSLSPHDRGRIDGYNRAIDDIKAKHGDLYVEVK